MRSGRKIDYQLALHCRRWVSINRCTNDTIDRGKERQAPGCRRQIALLAPPLPGKGGLFRDRTRTCWLTELHFGSRRAFSGSMRGQSEYYLSFVFAAVATIGATGVLVATGMVIPGGVLLAGVLAPGLLLMLHLYYGQIRKEQRLELLTGSMALMLWSAACAAIIAHVGMRFRLPLVDDMLADADLAIGIDTPRLVLAFAGHPLLGDVLYAIYLSAVPAVVATILSLSLSGRAKRTWEAIFGYCSGLVICSLMSVAWPALANFVHSGLTQKQTSGLPSSAGVFFLDSVRYFRDGHNPIVDPSQFDGVVTFPSFHAIMALIVAYAWRGGAFSGLVYFWAVILIISTVPIGGHYVVDLWAGGLLWLACIYLGRSRAAVVKPAHHKALT